jgi:UDP-N-acetylglucosamine diphosphorylase / glucose-1-phosphate thymidylyltransferase / UDP-N-acetylgalactosamine diphosphorylase / glucosamine-1-phosphate N-acetyltransferase / galactosamine-1-phosphate N-acetyltransferase
MIPSIADLIDRWPNSPFGHLSEPAWTVTNGAARHIAHAIAKLPGDYQIAGEIAVHRSASIETGAIVKGPAIIGPRCFVAATAYLRGGIFIDEDCVIGPGAELKSTFIFKGSKAAHRNFVGDSIIGSAVNLEAGSVIANYRNELERKAVRIIYGGQAIETGAEKFGALIGDRVRIGANAVIAPGAFLAKDQIIPRLSLVDQQPARAT